MAKTKTKSSPVQKARRKRIKREEARRNLWVVIGSRMKMYDDIKILGPGQIVERHFLINDGKLLENGYVRPVDVTEEFEKCEGCGTLWLGTTSSGPYAAHQTRARHSEAVTDVDNPILSRPAPEPKHRSDAEGDPNSEKEGAWDIEEEGAPPPTRIEDEVGSKTSISL